MALFFVTFCVCILRSISELQLPRQTPIQLSTPPSPSSYSKYVFMFINNVLYTLIYTHTIPTCKYWNWNYWMWHNLIILVSLKWIKDDLWNSPKFHYHLLIDNWTNLLLISMLRSKPRKIYHFICKRHCPRWWSKYFHIRTNVL